MTIYCCIIFLKLQKMRFTLMLNLRKKIIFSFLSSLMILSLLACSSEATPKSPDIEVPVQAKVKEILDSMPPTSTLAPTPRPVVKPTVVVVDQPTPTATPMISMVRTRSLLRARIRT